MKYDHKSTVASLSRTYLVPTNLGCLCLGKVSRTLQMSRDRQAPSLQTSLRADFQLTRKFSFPVPSRQCFLNYSSDFQNAGDQELS